jgi:large-conductance mechanosensitive channel
MAIKEQIIIRIAVGTIVGLALTNFGLSIYRDLLKPIFHRRIFTTIDKELRNDFIITIFGAKINYGDLFESLLVFVATMTLSYMTMHYLEINRLLK